MSDETELIAPLSGTVISVAHGPDEEVPPGEALIVLESMKMEHEVFVPTGGVVQSLAVAVGDMVEEGQLLAVVRPGAAADGRADEAGDRTEQTRSDLQAVLDRHALTKDQARPEAVSKRHEQGRRTARENVADLIDPGTFVEYGPLIFAAQERRRPKDELIARTPADGLIAGVGEIGGQPTIAMSYDYTVLAGTQGMRNHFKKDRLFEIPSVAGCPSSCLRRGAAGGRAMSTGRTSRASTAVRSTCSRS